MESSLTLDSPIPVAYIAGMDSLTAENYLKALLHLAGTSGEVGASALAKKLHLKMPTVSSMMKKLARRGLVQYSPYRPLRLTPRGRREALLIIRKHRLIEKFLVEKMHFRWDQVHDIAEQVEHVHAPELFERMDAMLGFPKIDPHGEPIPDKDGKVERAPLRTLSSCKERETVTLRAVTDASTIFLTFLNDRELLLGVSIAVRSVEPIDGSMKITYGRKHRETLSHLICERLLVEKR
jgi:DtxR family transcriptional regulator, Mn-dependent transcriptional regulator